MENVQTIGLKPQTQLVLVTFFTNYISWTDAWEGRVPQSQAELVQKLCDTGHIKSEEVANVMRRVDRANYANGSGYTDEAVYLGYNSTISPPQWHAYALEELKDHLMRGRKALDIGCGSGYLTVCMGLLMPKKAHVIGIDHMRNLIRFAHESTLREHPDLIKKEKVIFLTGEAREGVPEDMKYDAIYIGGSMPIVPDVIVDQLKIGGRMLVPVDPGDGEEQRMVVIDKDMEGNIFKMHKGPTYFRPLEHRKRQWRGKPRILKHLTMVTQPPDFDPYDYY